jgi:hypothetical protein
VHKILDRVCETTIGTSTGNLTLAGAVAGFRTFAAAGYANNETFFYCIEAVDSNGVPTGDWEVGYGTYVSATPAIARTKVSASSNSNALVNFAAGTKRVFVTLPIAKVEPVVPTVISVGTQFSSTGVPTATLPATHAADDILLLLIQQANQVDYAAPAGYERLGPQNGIGAAGAAGSTKLCMFWKRDNGAESAPTLTDSGDHTFGVMLAIRGADTLEKPHLLMQGFKFVASTTAGTSSGGGGRGWSKVPHCLYLGIFAHAVDSASAQGSGQSAVTMVNVTEVFDGSTTDGVGGGIYVMSGELDNHVGLPFTMGLTWANSTVDVSQMIAFVPNGYQTGSARRSPEVQIFIGSPADLDDNWRKPSYATRVFVQKCDGGQGGSGGNTTTTAAGGGGGAGGGYDEAWFDHAELSANVTVHAGRGGAVGTGLNQAGTAGTVSWFDTNGPLIAGNYNTGTVATAAGVADGGNGGCGGGIGTPGPVQTTRLTVNVQGSSVAGSGLRGAPGGSGTTAPVGGSEAEWGGGGGESGADTDAAITSANNGNSQRGGGGGSGGRTNTIISQPGRGGGAAATFAAQGATGAQSTRLPYGGAGGVNGGSSVVLGGTGGFPGGGGGGGAGVAGGFGGAGGHGCVVVTTHFE